jgi:mannan polymerase II complex MNN11 subunit
MNSYSPESGSAAENGVYKDKDFIVRLAGCDTDPRRDCEKEMEPYWKMWLKQKGD